MPTTREVEIPERLTEALDALADNLLASDAFLHYHRAAERSARDRESDPLMYAHAEQEAIAFLREIN